jgi:ribosomal protein S18 acetylase RimI-like enzyme
MDGLVIRPATGDDCDRIAAIIDDPPSAQAIAICGDERRARAAGRLLVRHGLSITIDSTVLATIDGAVVGIMDAGIDRKEFEPAPLDYVRLLIPVLRAIGPAALVRYVRSRQQWERVSFTHGPRDYYIAELDVAQAYRNRGIGAALLRHAEDEARRLDATRMSLSTNIENPAQHLYVRAGYRIVETKRDAAYRRWGGSEGRVFMVKDW